MRKQELVQLHALGAVVREHLESRHAFPRGPFEQYDGSPVAPASIHRRKDEHRDALFCLLDGVVAATDEVTSSTDRAPSTDGGTGRSEDG